ncbi:thioesterase family protein [Bradyrhizobium sp. WD16]|uniref:thioesterase family protein n=1 Tax=Bradyrhizobium sp. WD16 TaxID=1521768 RepID=UPI0020A3D93A|nr:thioesterase family protein [Bradyrhizobium sp. WD16]UTD28000.1 thioesterase [Bradyrhizobium sp. WD16]
MTDSTAAPPLHLEPALFVCSAMRVEPEWIDYNGHLNMAYYNVLFDRSLDQFLAMLGIGADYLRRRNKSTMTAECHVRYLREIHVGDPVRVHMLLLAADDKRLHTFEELRHAEDGFVSATSENMTLHIDMAVRRVAPFPADIAERIQAVVAAQADVPRPDGIGRRIAMPAR